MAMISAGMFTGFLFISILKLKDNQRYPFFIINTISFGFLMIIFPILKNGYAMLPLVFLIGFGNYVVNAFFGAIMSIIVPQNKEERYLF